MSEQLTARLLNTLPVYYRESRQANAIMGAHASLLQNRRDEASDLLTQLEIGSATWALENYEKILGIRTQPNKPIAERREVVKARLRGTANTTISQLKTVAESFYGGKIEITTDYPNYTIRVKFISSIGVPSNLADVERAIRDIVPAHIAFMFDFSYLLVRDVRAMTLNKLQTQKVETFAFK